MFVCWQRYFLRRMSLLWSSYYSFRDLNYWIGWKIYMGVTIIWETIFTNFIIWIGQHIGTPIIFVHMLRILYHENKIWQRYQFQILADYCQFNLSLFLRAMDSAKSCSNWTTSVPWISEWHLALHWYKTHFLNRGLSLWNELSNIPLEWIGKIMEGSNLQDKDNLTDYLDLLLHPRLLIVFLINYLIMGDWWVSKISQLLMQAEYHFILLPLLQFYIYSPHLAHHWWKDMILLKYVHCCSYGYWN